MEEHVIPLVQNERDVRKADFASYMHKGQHLHCPLPYSANSSQSVQEMCCFAWKWDGYMVNCRKGDLN